MPTRVTRFCCKTENPQYSQNAQALKRKKKMIQIKMVTFHPHNYDVLIKKKLKFFFENLNYQRTPPSNHEINVIVMVNRCNLDYFKQLQIDILDLKLHKSI